MSDEWKVGRQTMSDAASAGLKAEIDSRQCSICDQKFPDAQSIYLHRMKTNGHCRASHATKMD